MRCTCVGVMDWRMLVMLTREPECSGGRAAQLTGIDKAAVSRSLQRLEAAGLAQAEAPPEDERRKSWRLTAAGHALHARVLPYALERQRDLLKGFSADEVATLTGLLQRCLANLGETATEGSDPDGPAAGGAGSDGTTTGSPMPKVR